jgi:hypothetical protein
MRQTAARQGGVTCVKFILASWSLLVNWRLEIAESMGFQGEFRQWEDLLRLAIEDAARCS